MTSVLDLSKKVMRKVLVALTIVNRADQTLTKHGIISNREVRSFSLNSVLVDTGATTLCLEAGIRC